jgi:hypothetical protein
MLSSQTQAIEQLHLKSWGGGLNCILLIKSRFTCSTWSCVLRDCTKHFIYPLDCRLFKNVQQQIFNNIWLSLERYKELSNNNSFSLSLRLFLFQIYKSGLREFTDRDIILPMFIVLSFLWYYLVFLSGNKYDTIVWWFFNTLYMYMYCC